MGETTLDYNYKRKREKMSGYCDTCDNTMKKTTRYLVDGQHFNYCANCVQDNGYYGKEGK
jgi:hypothetical protein